MQDHFSNCKVKMEGFLYTMMNTINNDMLCMQVSIKLEMELKKFKNFQNKSIYTFQDSFQIKY